MLRPFQLVLASLCMAVVCFSAAAEDTVIFPALSAELLAAKPVSLLSDNLGKDFKFEDRSPADKPASFTVIGTMNGSPVFSGANQVASKTSYTVQVQWNTSHAVKAGDAVLMRFAARARKAKQESGEAALNFYFQHTSPPWEKDVSMSLGVGPEWTVFEIPFVIKKDFDAGQVAAYIAMGSLEQTVEFTGLQVLNFENRLAVGKLPATRFTYAGREPDAAWRAAALKRIEQIRTNALTIKVVDATGKPVNGAKVDVAMTQSAFLFGSEVDADVIAADTSEAERYRKTVLELFDTVTIGNGLKWGRWIDPVKRKNSEATIDWLAANHIRLRGHNLVWTGYNFTPESIKKDPGFPGNLKDKIDEHIRDEAAALKGKVILWDVINEPIHEKDYFKSMPEDTMVHWFQLARQMDPKAKLLINEYGMLNDSGSVPMIKKYVELVHALREKGAPIEGMGVQGHIGQQPRSIPSVLTDLDLLSSEKLPLQITEFDIETLDEQLQADYTRDLLLATYSHPSVEGFIMWGFYEPRHWKPRAAMFKPDWSEKPNAKVWRDLVVNQWRTKFDAVTSNDGVVSARGHHGRYHAVVTVNGKKTEADFDLSKDSNKVLIRLK